MPAPVVASIVPDHCAPGSSVRATIFGTGFTGASSVQIDGVECPYWSVLAANRIAVRTPPRPTTRPCDVVVTVPTSGSGILADGFLVRPPRLFHQFGSNETYLYDRIFYLGAQMGSHRTVLRWDYCEPTIDGGISFANADPITGQTYDQLVTRAVADGVEIIFTISYVPEWAREPGWTTIGGGGYQIAAAYRARFQSFCQAAAAHFGTSVIYEVFNEVTSLDFYWDTVDYFEILELAGLGLKAGNPDCVIMLAGMVSPGLESIPHSETPEHFFGRACKDFASLWERWSAHFYGASGFPTYIEINLGILKAIALIHALDAREFYVGETASGAKDYSEVVPLSEQAKDVVKRAMGSFATGASRFMWWPNSDAYLSEENPSGLNPTAKCLGLCWRPARVELDAGEPYVSHARLAYTAFQVMVSKLGGWTSCDLVSGHSAYRLTVNGHPVWVVWGTGALPNEIGGKIRVTTHLGEESSALADSVVLTDAPIYVERWPGYRANAATASGNATRRGESGTGGITSESGAGSAYAAKGAGVADLEAGVGRGSFQSGSGGISAGAGAGVGIVGA